MNAKTEAEKVLFNRAAHDILSRSGDLVVFERKDRNGRGENFLFKYVVGRLKAPQKDSPSNNIISAAVSYHDELWEANYVMQQIVIQNNNGVGIPVS
jgi:hypothetical protein